MLFTSFRFALFLAALLLVYYLLPKKLRWWALLLFSAGYFAVTGAANLALITATWLTSYLASRLMGGNLARQRQTLALYKEEWDKPRKKAYKAAEKKKRFAVLVTALVFNFGLVALLKLDLFGLGSFATRLNGLWHLSNDWEVLTLLGLSFYTFQTMGYLIEVYREKQEPERNPLRLALWVCFFPLMIQGPICRTKDAYIDLFEGHDLSLANLSEGALRIMWGLFKKLLVASRVADAVMTVCGDSVRFRGGWFFLVTVLYSVKIYADFTGGIDMTIGIARLFGIGLPENFRQPFFSRSTKEYWNRWHISLGEWFTDYLFYPLSVCRPMLALSSFSRKHLGENVGKRVPVYLATILTWFVTGLWHGTAWNFIVWGLLNCLVILISQELAPLQKKFRAACPRFTGSKFYAGFEMLHTFLLMGFIRILDVYGDVPKTFSLFFGMFLPRSWQNMPSLSAFLGEIGIGASDLVILACGIVTMFTVSVFSYSVPMTKRLADKPLLRVLLLLLLVTVTVLFGRYGYGYDANAFRYA